jgi:hypothetical protein
MKDKDIEKNIYLSQLKDVNPSMFYKLALAHMSVSTFAMFILHSYSLGNRKSPLSYIRLQLETLVCCFHRTIVDRKD